MNIFRFLFLVLSTFSTFSLYAFEFKCPPPGAYLEYKCNGNVTVDSLAELNSYLVTLGLNKDKIKNLIIDFDITTNSNLNISTPCQITIKDNIQVNAQNLCLHGTKGVKIGNNYRTTSQDLRIEAADEIILESNATIDSWNFELVAKNLKGKSNTRIGDHINVHARNFFMESSGRSNIGKDSSIVVERTLGIYSQGDDVAVFKRGSNVTASVVEISSMKRLRVDPYVTISAINELILNAENCIIRDEGTVLSAPSKLGSCLPEQVPVVRFSTDKIIGSAPLIVGFNASQISGGSSFNWSFGDGTVVTTSTPIANHTYLNEGLYSASLKYIVNDDGQWRNGGAVQITAIPKINLAPVASLNCTTINMQVNCHGLGSFDPEGSQLTYFLEFGDGSTATSEVGVFSHNYLVPGLHEIKLTVKDPEGLSSVATTSVQVVLPANELPHPILTCVSDVINQVSCHGAGSNDPDGTIVVYEYEFDDSNSITKADHTEVVHTFQTSGEHIVRLTVSDNDGGINFVETVVLVKTNTNPVSQFTCESTELFKVKCQSTSFDPDSPNDMIQELTWDMGDGEIISTTTSNSVEYQYLSGGMKNISLIVKDSYGATHTVIKDVLVRSNTSPVALLGCTSSNMLVTCDGLSSYDPDGQTLTYRFIYGDGYSEQNTSGVSTHAFDEPGTYSVSLLVTDILGGESIATTTVMPVLPPNELPIAYINCTSPRPFFLECSSSGSTDSDGNIVSYQYNWGDGTSDTKSDQNMISHRFETPGPHSVILVAIDNDGGVSSVSNTFNVKANTLPLADFNCTPNYQNLKIKCQSNSADSDFGDSIVEFKWTMGDGEVVNGPQAEVAHLYTEAGDYQVSLEVMDTHGGKSSKTKAFVILDSQAPQIAFQYPTGQNFAVDEAQSFNISVIDDESITGSIIELVINENKVGSHYYSVNSETNLVQVTLPKSSYFKKGANTVSFSVAPSNGITTVESVVYNLVDNSAPTIFLSPSEDFQFTTENGFIEIIVTDPSRIDWSTLVLKRGDSLLNSDLYTKEGNKLTIDISSGEVLEAGINQFSISIKDSEGNQADRSFAYSFDPSDISFDFIPGTNTKIENITDLVSVYPVAQEGAVLTWSTLKVYWNGVELTDDQFSKTPEKISVPLDFTNVKSGILKVSMTDGEGRTSIGEAKYSLRDLVPPVISFSIPDGAELSNTVAPDIKIVLQDESSIDETGISLLLNGTVLPANNYIYDASSGEIHLRLTSSFYAMLGQNVLNVLASDVDGNHAQKDLTFNVVDTEGPSIAFTPQVRSSFVTNWNTVAFNVKDISEVNWQSLRISLNGVPVPMIYFSIANGSVIINFNPDFSFELGENIINVSIQDIWGNLNEISAPYFLLEKKLPQIAFSPDRGTRIKSLPQTIEAKFNFPETVNWASIKLKLNNTVLSSWVKTADDSITISLGADSQLVQGINLITANFKNVDGSENNELVPYFLDDLYPPTLNVAPEIGHQFPTQNAVISFEAKDDGGIDWQSFIMKLNDKVVTADRYNIKGNVGNASLRFNPGVNTLSLSVKDKSGKETVVNKTYRVIDTIGPKYKFTPGNWASFESGNGQSFKISIQDDSGIKQDSIQVWLNGRLLPSDLVEWASSESELTVSLDQSTGFKGGNNSVRVKSSDTLNHVSEASVSYKLTDVSFPRLALYPESETIFVNNKSPSIKISFEDESDIDFINAAFYLNSVKINSSDILIDSINKHFLVTLNNHNLKLGQNEFKSVVSDAFGNNNAMVATYSLSDTNPPAISYLPTSGTLFTSLDQVVAMNVSDLTEIDWPSLKLELNGNRIESNFINRHGNDVAIVFSKNNPLKQGENVIAVTVKDVSGNEQNSTVSYQLNDIFPASFDFLPESGNTLSAINSPVSIAVLDDGELKWNTLQLKLNGVILPASFYEVEGSSVQLSLSQNFQFHKGLNFLDISIEDINGNKGTASATYLVLPTAADNSGPGIAFNLPAGEITSSPEKIIVSLQDSSGIDFNRIRISLNGISAPESLLSINRQTSKVEVNFDQTFKILPGQNILSVLATDNLNNVGGKSISYVLVNELTNANVVPVITFNPHGGELVSNTPTIQVFLSAVNGIDYSSLQVMLNNSLIDQQLLTVDQSTGKLAVSFNASNPLPDEDFNILKVQVRDLLGNSGEGLVGFDQKDSDFQVVDLKDSDFGGGYHTCVVLYGGSLRCFGLNNFGQLGLGNTNSIGDNELPSTAALVNVGETVQQVSTSDGHTCALTVSGKVMCWGRNDFGQLGYGHTNNIGDNELPISQGYVKIGEPATQIAVSTDHSCALLSSGGVKCWGRGLYGRLGQGNQNNIGDTSLPLSVLPINVGGAAKMVVAGNAHTCVLLETDDVRCFGKGTQIGQSTILDSNNRIPASYPIVNLGGKVKQIVAGYVSTCAILDSAKVKCWGGNFWGNLGYGNLENIGDNETPVSAGDVSIGEDVSRIALGDKHVCALLVSGYVKCWGENSVGQLGYGNTTFIGDDELPSSVGYVDLGGKASAIWAGAFHTCAGMNDGKLKCWGYNNGGQLGLNSTQRIGDNELPSAVGYASIGGNVSLEENDQGTLNLGNVHTCVLLQSGVKCWGYGGAGYLGYGNTDNIGDNELPSSVGYVSLGGVPKAVVNGNSHSCALLVDGSVKCWGISDSGQLGLGNTNTIGDNEVPSSQPVLSLGGEVKQIVAGGLHTCSLKTDNSINCWGLGSFGRLGYGNENNIGDTELPSDAGSVDVGATTEIVQMVAGVAHTCILTADGKMKCWGRNQYRQLGIGAVGEVIGDNESPSAKPFLDFGEPVLKIAAGGEHTCAILQSGKLKCWGRNDNGQLGLAHTNLLTTSMLDLPFVNVGENVKAVSAGTTNTCVITVSDKARCWGLNSSGQLGLGNTIMIGDNEAPASVAAIDLGGPVVKIDTSGTYTCALVLNGNLYCWGNGSLGKLGYGNVTNIGDNELPLTAGKVSLDGGILVAKFSVDQYFGPSPLTVVLNGTLSSSSGSPIVNYSWDFGDGNTLVETTGSVSHTYMNQGVYLAKLTVIDSNNSEASFTRSITVGQINNPPIASFAVLKDFGAAPFDTTFDASGSLDSNGTIAKYYWNFGDGVSQISSTPIMNHTYSNPGVYLATLKVEDNFGDQASAFPLAITVKELNTLPFNNFDCSSNGKKLSCNARASGDLDGYITNFKWELSDGRTFEGAKLHALTTEFMEDGEYSVQLTITDDSAGSSVLSRTLSIDSIAPEISTNIADHVLTKNPEFHLTATITELKPSITKVFKNGQIVASTNETAISEDVILSEGVNVFVIESKDTAGNVTTKTILSDIVLDTLVPELSNVFPSQGQEIRTQNVPIRGQFNEKVSSVTVNGEPATLAEDGKSFAYAYSTFTEAEQSVDIDFTDMAGNSSSFDLRFPVLFNILHIELVSIHREGHEQLKVVGAIGASRGNSEVEVSAGYFNSESTTSNADGSFEVVMDYFTSAQVSVTSNERTEFAQIRYDVDTTLAGTIQDTDGNPLPGVLVKIKDTDAVPAVTNSSGIFTFSNPPTGDRQLIVDAQNIPEAAIGTTKKFSVLEIPVSIGTRQANVLEKVIHLAPLLLDGTELVVESGVGVNYESANVPGASLEIPASVEVEFPEGNSLNAINMVEISKDKTTVPVIREAEPDTVIALEPSGLTFSEPVPLTLPNTNELPAGMQVVIYSKNSKNGNWEIDGVARVSENGQQIQTEEGMGITHFSEVYAAPLGLKYSQINSEDKPGIDTFGGGVSTSIDFPGYKALGSEIAPKLLYKSNWAHPTAVVKNMFTIPTDVEIIDQGGERVLKPSETTINTWVVPEKVDVSFIAGDYHSPKSTFTGNPNNAVISLGIDFANQPSGVMPFAANYEIHLKRMVIRSAEDYPPGLGLIRPNPKVYEFSIPSELRGQVYIQNKSSSAVGRGWMIGGVQKIQNPTASRIMLEEEDGSVSTYVVDNKIQTIAKFEKSFSGLSKIYENEISVSGEDDSVHRINLTTGIKTSLLTAMSFSGNYRSSAIVFKQKCVMWTKNGMGGKICLKHARVPYCLQKERDYTANPTKKFVIPSPGNDGYILATEKGLITLHNSESQILVSNVKNAPNSDQNSTFCVNDAQCSKSRLLNDFLMRNENCPAGGSSSGSYYDLDKDHMDGELTDARFNSIKAIAPSTTSNGFAVADYGNNRVRFVDLNTRKVSTIAGIGKAENSGDGGPAINAGLDHPRGVVYDEDGNLFVSTEDGYIKKIDRSSGRISHFAGKPNGVLYDSAKASEMYLSRPYGMVIDHMKSYLYVADTGNNRILQIDLLTNMAKTVAGNGLCQVENTTAEYGTALGASICAPEFVVVDENHNLIIADTGHRQIRRVIFSDSESGILKYDSVVEDNSSLARNLDGSFTRTFRNGIKTQFDSAGKHLATIDRTGRTVSNEYDLQGKLIEQTDPVGGVIRYEYGGYEGKLSSIRYENDQREFRFSYSPAGDLATVSYPDGTSKHFSYTEDGLLTEETDERDNSTQYEYSNWFRLAKIIRPDGKNISFIDSTTNNLANNYTEGNQGELKQYGTDQNQLVDGIKDAKGITTTFLKDESGYVSIIIDGEGKETKVERDLKGRPTKIIRPDESFVEFVYNLNSGDLLSKKDSASNTNDRFVYNTYGQLVSSQDSQGRKIINEYDNRGLLARTINEVLGVSMSYQYNSLGLLVSQTDSLGQTSQVTYDSKGNILSSVNPEGKETRYSYFPTGLVQQVIDPNLNAIKYEFDVMNRLSSVTTGENQKTSYTYFETGELKQIHDPYGHETNFSYNNLGLLTKKVGTRGEVINLTHDENGNVISETTPNGQVKLFQYDNMNRLLSKILPDDRYDFSYDIRGNITSIKNDVSEIQFGYQHFGAGDVISQVSYKGLGEYANLPSGALSYGYNSAGEKVSTTTPIGNFSYGRDAAGRLRSITNPEGQGFNLNYDLKQRLVGISSPAMNTSFEFDPVGFNTKINYTRKSGATVERFIYGRDLAGNRTSKTTLAGTSQYNYDKNYQLLQAITPNLPEENFSYDEIGNRTSDNNSNYVYQNSKQQIKEDYKYLYVFDLNGNLISKQEKGFTGNVQNFEYSSENQLRKFKLIENGVLTKEVTYTFDALGRRIEKEVVDLQDQNKSFTRRFIYDGNEVLAEYNEDNNLISSYTHSTLRTDDVLSVTNAQGTFYFVKDAQGSITDITDENGNKVQHHEYTSFGKLAKVTDAIGNDISNSPILDPYFTYTGREYDKETGLYYYRARYYDPNIGRFLSSDPDAGRLSSPSTFNTKYAYVANNPINLIDPSGKSFGLADIGNAFKSISLVASIRITLSRHDQQQLTTAAIIVAAITVGILTGGTAAPAAAAALGGGALGAAGGFVAGIAVGATFGALTGAAIGGTASVLMGGGFGSGAVAGGKLGLIAGAIGGGIGALNPSAFGLGESGGLGKFIVNNYISLGSASLLYPLTDTFGITISEGTSPVDPFTISF